MLINSPNISGSLTVTGNIVASGSLTVAGAISGTVSGTATSASYVEYTNVANKPALVSGSSQVTYSGLTGIPSGIVSGSAQITGFGIFATTGSNQFNGSQAITGSLTTTGTIVAQTLNVQQVTSSIVYSSGSNIFGNSLANTQQFTGSLQVSGSSHYLLGNVGIGTTSPTVRLDVSTTSGENYIRVNSAANQDSGYRIAEGGTNKWLLYNVAASDAFAIYDNTSVAERLRITSTGAVAIGATSTNGRLGVRGTTNDSSAYAFEAANSSGNSLFLVRNDGRVGVGPGAPNGSYSLTLAGDSSGYTGGIVFKQSSTDTFYIGNPSTSNTTDFEFWNPRNGYTRFATNNTERMRITSTGDVGIGTTNPSKKLHVYTSNNEGIFLQGTGGGVWMDVQASGGELWSFGADTGGAGIYNRTDNAYRFYVNNAGNIGIGTTDPSFVSGTYPNKLYVNGSSQYFGVLTVQNAINTGDVNHGIINLYNSKTAAVGDDARIMFTFKNADGSIHPRASMGAINAGDYAASLQFNTRDLGAAYTEKMRLTYDGKLGINDTNPQTRLSINGANYIEMATFACTSAAATTIVTDNAGYVQFSNGNARHISNSSVFTPVTDGIRILKAGIVQVTVSQDIRTAGTTGYALLFIQKNKSTVSENLITNTNNEWDGINGVATIAVSADDVINFYYSAADITSLDANTWSQYSFIWASR